jgi:hypothetical protein
VGGEAAGHSASLAYKAYKLWKLFLLGGWVAKLLVILVLVALTAWWVAGVITLGIFVSQANAKGAEGVTARAVMIGLTSLAAASQIAINAVVGCYLCCAVGRKVRGRRRGRGRGRAAAVEAGSSGGGAPEVSSGGSSATQQRRQPLLPETVRMPAYPVSLVASDAA